MEFLKLPFQEINPHLGIAIISPSKGYIHYCHKMTEKKVEKNFPGANIVLLKNQNQGSKSPFFDLKF